MPVLGAMGGTLAKIVISMIMSLLTEEFLKKSIVIGLSKLVKMTATDADDKLLEAAKKSWKIVD